MSMHGRQTSANETCIHQHSPAFTVPMIEARRAMIMMLVHPGPLPQSHRTAWRIRTISRMVAGETIMCITRMGAVSWYLLTERVPLGRAQLGASLRWYECRTSECPTELCSTASTPFTGGWTSPKTSRGQQRFLTGFSLRARRMAIALHTHRIGFISLTHRHCLSA